MNPVVHIKDWWTWSIHRKLIGTSVAILLCSLSFLGYFSLRTGQSAIRDWVTIHNSHLAAVTARAVDTHFNGIWESLSNLASRMEHSPDAFSQQAKLMSELRVSSPKTYRGLYLLDSRGNLLVRVDQAFDGLQAAESIDPVSRRPALEPNERLLSVLDQLGNRSYYITPVYLAGSDQVPVVDIAIATSGAGDFSRQVLIAEIDLQDFWRTIDVIRIGERGNVYVVSREGMTIAHADRSFIGGSIAPELKPVTEGYEGQVTFTDPLSGRRMLAYYSPVGKRSGWGVVVEQEIAEAYRSVNRIALITSAIFCIALLISSATTLFIARSVTRPLKNLAEKTRIIAETGSLGHELPVESGDEVGRLTGTFNQMIRSLRRKEEMIRHSEQRFQSIVETAPCILLIRDRKGINTYVSPNCAEVTDYSEEELLGTTLLWAHQDDLPGLLGLFERTLESGNGGRNHEYRAVKKNGEIWYASTSWEPLRNRDGGITGILLQTLDMTDKRVLETKLLQSQRLEAVGTLAGGVAHDFNNMMLVINGYCELLMKRTDSEDPNYRYLEQIMNAGERATSVTRQLLAFSRNQVLQPRPLALNDLIINMQKMLKQVIKEDILLKMTLDPDIGTIEADPTQIDQVLLNLTVNACDAMPTGGELVFETANAELTGKEISAGAVESIKPGSYVKLCVSDTGSGMDRQTLTRIFEPFFTTKEQGKGTGLGLATVYGIIKQSGGDIRVYSEKGSGTSFQIYFPRVEQEIAPQNEQVAESGFLEGSETILLVEDDEMVRQLVRETLTQNGYRVFEADSGAAAIELYNRQAASVQLVLTDVVMPGMSGTDLASNLHAIRSDLKVLFMSGFSRGTIENYGIDDAFTDLIQKPFAATDLLKKMRKLLGGHAALPPAG